MSFRVRLLVTFLVTVLVPLVGLALLVRGEMTRRLTAQYESRVESLVGAIENDLVDESRAISRSLVMIREAVHDDNRFRRAAVDRAPEDRPYLLDYAGEAMGITGLSMLQIQDEAGRIISSGHFRNEYDRLEPELPSLLASAPAGMALLRARSPDTPFLALARVDSLRLGNRVFMIVGGVRVGARFLARLGRGPGLAVELSYPGGWLSPDADRTSSAEVAPDRAIVRELTLPFIDAEGGDFATATVTVTHRLSELDELRRSVDRWFLVAVAVTGLLAVLVVGWITRRISRPLAELADKTSQIDLDRLDIDFDTAHKDEIGMLSRLLGAMTDRLRSSAALIKDAERRATLGEMARQVNHDIKNGLTPIRNVFRHLIELAKRDPKELPAVLRERQNTLDSSIAYLETLASNYARLSPKTERQACDVSGIVEHVARDRRAARSVDLRVKSESGAVVLGDPLSLRRILENLIDNAIDSLPSGGGLVNVSVEATSEAAGRRVRVTVADTGRGMDGEEQAKVFNDFYTTKTSGTGLGLSIVRRLVIDLDGSITVKSEPGKGSRFVIDLPGAGQAPNN